MTTKPECRLWRVYVVIVVDPSARSAWVEQIHYVLGRLPVDAATGKPTTRGMSDRRLRHLFARAERMTKRQSPRSTSRRTSKRLD